MPISLKGCFVLFAWEVFWGLFSDDWITRALSGCWVEIPTSEKELFWCVFCVQSPKFGRNWKFPPNYKTILETISKR